MSRMTVLTACSDCHGFMMCREFSDEYVCDDCVQKRALSTQATQAATAIDEAQRLKRDHDLMLANLTATQARCTALLEENRRLKKRGGYPDCRCGQCGICNWQDEPDACEDSAL